MRTHCMKTLAAVTLTTTLLSGIPFPVYPVAAKATNSAAKVDKELIFPDKQLEKLIRDKIGIKQGPIRQSHVMKLTTLEANKIQKISSLQGIQQLTSLASLRLDESPVTDLTPLTLMRNLQEISFRHLPADPRALQKMTWLRSLEITGSAIHDISFVGNLKQLTSLNLMDNSIIDLSPLTALKELDSIELSFNQIDDLKPLASLRPTSLYLTHNLIQDITPISNLTDLYALHLDFNKISDTSALWKSDCFLLADSIHDGQIDDKGFCFERRRSGVTAPFPRPEARDRCAPGCRQTPG